MMPIGPMMVEHRLIERMVALMQDEALTIRRTRRVNAAFVQAAVDFMRTYADRCHHGKEEDILFRDLKEKPLSPEHRAQLHALEAEHRVGRETVHRLAAARDRHLKGDPAAPDEIAAVMEHIAAFYPKHIDTEDQDFFEPCMAYFTPEEQERMLEECREFDRRLVHELYDTVVSGLEGGTRANRAPATSVLPDDPEAGRHMCMICGYTYDPRVGDPTGGIAPGVAFGDLPESWLCPHCHASRRAFIPSRR